MFDVEADGACGVVVHGTRGLTTGTPRYVPAGHLHLWSGRPPRSTSYYSEYVASPRAPIDDRQKGRS